MRVEASKQATQSRISRFSPQGAAGDATEPNSESRALVVTAPAAAIATRTTHRQATFLAHLIATKEHAPQTCERRRAEPHEALAAYRAADALTR